MIIIMITTILYSNTKEENWGQGIFLGYKFFLKLSVNYQIHAQDNENFLRRKQSYIRLDMPLYRKVFQIKI